MEAYLGTVLIRFAHVLFGILWIGLLYYFNFVQTEYFKDSEPSAKSDVVQKLVPNALWYFRWAAAFTFLTGLYLLYYLSMTVNISIVLGAGSCIHISYRSILIILPINDGKYLYSPWRNNGNHYGCKCLVHNLA